VDEWLSPLFAVDYGRVGALRAADACGFDCGLHLGDKGFTFGVSVDDGCDEANIFVDIGEPVWSEGENGESGFENCRERLHTVGHAGNHQIGFGREDLVGVRGPAVMEDV